MKEGIPTIHHFPTQSLGHLQLEYVQKHLVSKSRLLISLRKYLLPTEWATVSPNERDIANPGMSWSCNHTREGPEYPSSYSMAKTRPPACSIRFFSSGRLGLWSWVRSSTWNWSLLSEAMTALESPTLIVRRYLARIIQITAVVPLNSVLMNRSRI